MDDILLKLFRSPHAEPLRVAAIRVVTSRFLATSTEREPLSDQLIVRVVGAGASILSAAQSPDMARTAVDIIQQFAACSLSSVLDRTDECIIQPLLHSPSSPPSVQCIDSVFQLLSWLLASAADCQQAQFVSVLAHHLPQLVTWMGGGGLAATEWLAALTVWLLDDNMAVLKSCEQQRDSVSLVESLVVVLTSVPAPTDSTRVAVFTSRMSSIRRLLTYLLAIDTSHVTSVMHRLHNAMAGSKGVRCTGLSVVLLSLPQPVIQPACTELVRQHTCGGSNLLPSLLLLCDWIMLWPRDVTLSLWLLLLIKQLSAAGRARLLIQLTDERATQLFMALMLPAVRRAVFRVVSILLLGYQHSAEVFIKVQGIACTLVQRLRAEFGCVASELRELADLLYTLMHQHSSRCDTSRLMATLKGIESPSVSRMNALLQAAAWHSSPASSPNIDGRLVLPQGTGRPVPPTSGSMAVVRHRGLANLGNTCFMNSIIQALFSVNSFREAVLWSRPAPHHRLLSALQRVFAFLQYSALPVYSPSAFHQLALPPWFERGQQHDCYEFLRYILNALHDEQFGVAAPQMSPTRHRLSSPTFSSSATLRCVGYDDLSTPVSNSLDTAADPSDSLLRRLRRSSQSSATVERCDVTDADDDCVMTDVEGETGVRCHENSAYLALDHKPRIDEAQSVVANSSDTVDSFSPAYVLPPACTAVEPAISSTAFSEVNDNASTVSCCTVEDSSSSFSVDSDCSTLIPVASSNSVFTCSTASLCPVNGSPTTVLSDPSTSGVSSCSPPPNSPIASPQSPHLQITSDTFRILSTSSASNPLLASRTGPLTASSTSGSTSAVRCPDAEHRDSLVQRLLTGQMETTYRCLSCDRVSRHVDAFSDINLTFPERVNGRLSAAPPCCAPDQPLVVVPTTTEPPGGQCCSSNDRIELVSTDSGDDRVVSLPGQEVRQVSCQQVIPADHQSDSSLHVCDLFERYLSRERLTGDNRYWCSSCTTLCDADRQLRVLTPPLCLLVSLARFVYDRSAASRHKLLTPVRLGRHLHVPIESSSDGGVSHAVYTLQAVVVHTGMSLDAGHYYCCARTSSADGDAGGSEAAEAVPCSSDGEWWCFSDSSVTPIQLSDVLQLTERRPCDTAYLLVYVRHVPSQSSNTDSPGPNPAKLSRQMRQLPEGLLKAIRTEGGIM